MIGKCSTMHMIIALVQSIMRKCAIYIVWEGARDHFFKLSQQVNLVKSANFHSRLIPSLMNAWSFSNEYCSYYLPYFHCSCLSRCQMFQFLQCNNCKTWNVRSCVAVIREKTIEEICVTQDQKPIIRDQDPCYNEWQVKSCTISKIHLGWKNDCLSVLALHLSNCFLVE